MTSDFAGFDFLQAALHPVSDIKRGYGLGSGMTPDIKRGYGLGDAAMPDTTQHSAGAYMALPQS
ncbi:MAG: hypothetical protein ACRYHQ_04065 [Janthinobacterium lividum]